MRIRFVGLVVAALVAALSLSGCGNTIASILGVSYTKYLYMTDTVSGKVYAYDPSKQSAGSSSFASTGKNATGEIRFYNGIGYVAVGGGTDEGVYYFDPSATNPSFSKLGTAIAAQYFAFYSSSKAYVSSYDYSGTTSGLYSFNPSKPSSGLSAVAAVSGKYLQDLVVGSDGYLYAADNSNGAVLKVDPSSDALKATISTSAKGTTGLCKGTFNGSSGIFVASTGGYDSSYAALPGALDFISADGKASLVARTTSTGASIYPARVIQLDGGNLVATGYGHSYLVTLSGSSASTSELKTASGASFGSLDIAYKNALVYIPIAQTSDYISYSNKLYVLDESGKQASYSPVSVMKASEGLSNIGFYE
jgi:hypothetical protein